MKRNEILLSGGSILWYGLKYSLRYVKDIGYDGLEIVPSRNIAKEIKNITNNHNNNNLPDKIQNLNLIKSIHQNWRLDIGCDKSYGIKFPVSLLFVALRFIFFPNIKKSNDTIKFLSENLNIPITVHNLSDKWVKNNTNQEFPREILYEIIGTSITLDELKKWTENELHNIVVDSRDDQSLIWARKHGINKWQELWEWIGLKKIKGLQLTFIGFKGLKKIIKREKSISEEQLLWLYKKKWKGHVVVEANPLIVFFLFKGDMKKGFKIIYQFVQRTLVQGKKWSI